MICYYSRSILFCCHHNNWYSFTSSQILVVFSYYHIISCAKSLCHQFDKSLITAVSRNRSHIPCLLLWLWWWIYFSLACSPHFDWSLGVLSRTTSVEFYQDQQLHFPTDFSLKFYSNHSTRSNGRTDYLILFFIKYPTLFLPFSESQLHHYQVGSIYL